MRFLDSAGNFMEFADTGTRRSRPRAWDVSTLAGPKFAWQSTAKIRPNCLSNNVLSYWWTVAFLLLLHQACSSDEPSLHSFVRPAPKGSRAMRPGEGVIDRDALAQPRPLAWGWTPAGSAPPASPTRRSASFAPHSSAWWPSVMPRAARSAFMAHELRSPLTALHRDRPAVSRHSAQSEPKGHAGDHGSRRGEPGGAHQQPPRHGRARGGKAGVGPQAVRVRTCLEECLDLVSVSAMPEGPSSGTRSTSPRQSSSTGTALGSGRSSSTSFRTRSVHQDRSHHRRRHHPAPPRRPARDSGGRVRRRPGHPAGSAGGGIRRVGSGRRGDHLPIRG